MQPTGRWRHQHLSRAARESLDFPTGSPLLAVAANAAGSSVHAAATAGPSRHRPAVAAANRPFAAVLLSLRCHAIGYRLNASTPHPAWRRVVSDISDPLELSWKGPTMFGATRAYGPRVHLPSQVVATGRPAAGPGRRCGSGPGGHKPLPNGQQSLIPASPNSARCGDRAAPPGRRTLVPHTRTGVGYEQAVHRAGGRPWPHVAAEGGQCVPGLDSCSKLGVAGPSLRRSQGVSITGPHDEQMLRQPQQVADKDGLREQPTAARHFAVVS
jgi:hypothetical protein